MSALWLVGAGVLLGLAPCVLLTFRGKRELKRKGAELVERKREIARLQAELKTLLHDLRNPLGTLRNSLYLLRTRLGTEDEGLLALLDRADRSVTRCESICAEGQDRSLPGGARPLSEQRPLVAAPPAG